MQHLELYGAGQKCFGPVAWAVGSGPTPAACPAQATALRRAVWSSCAVSCSELRLDRKSLVWLGLHGAEC